MPAPPGVAPRHGFLPELLLPESLLGHQRFRLVLVQDVGRLTGNLRQQKEACLPEACRVPPLAVIPDVQPGKGDLVVGPRLPGVLPDGGPHGAKTDFVKWFLFWFAHEANASTVGRRKAIENRI